MSVFCIWNEAINRICEKDGPSYNYVWKTIELNFPTWEQAHSWLIAKREKELQSAEDKLKAAKRSLHKARAMTATPPVSEPESGEQSK